MEIIEENQNPSNNICTGKPEKYCVDWCCTNPECTWFDKPFVDGGPVFTPAKVKFTCGYCGTSETTMIYTDYKTESKVAS